MRWFWNTYIGNTGENFSPRATPLHAMNLSSLPATLLVTAGNDPLRDEGIAYGEKLKEAKVAIKHLHFAQDQHGFACNEGMTDNFEKLMGEICAWLDSLNKH